MSGLLCHSHAATCGSCFLCPPSCAVRACFVAGNDWPKDYQRKTEVRADLPAAARSEPQLFAKDEANLSCIDRHSNKDPTAIRGGFCMLDEKMKAP